MCLAPASAPPRFHFEMPFSSDHVLASPPLLFKASIIVYRVHLLCAFASRAAYYLLPAAAHAERPVLRLGYKYLSGRHSSLSPNNTFFTISKSMYGSRGWLGLWCSCFLKLKEFIGGLHVSSSRLRASPFTGQVLQD
jgi:hypothetical protein